MLRSRSLRSRIIILMSLLVALQSLTFVVALASSRIFFALDAEAFRIFENSIETKARKFNQDMDSLTDAAAVAADGFSNKTVNFSKSYSLTPQNIKNNRLLYKEVIMTATESIIMLLHSNNITGAFVIFDNKDGSRSNDIHSGVYIRNTTPEKREVESKNLTMEIGPAFLSAKYDITLGMNWDIAINFTRNNCDKSFYYMPLYLVKEYPDLKLSEYGYWKDPSSILNHNRDVIIYSLPLLDSFGNTFGIMGIEISLSYFEENYLHYTDMIYDTSFYALASCTDKTIELDWYIPGNSIVKQHLDKEKTIRIKNVPGTPLYQANLMDMGEMFCSLQPLKLYGKGSPKYESKWSLVGFVPKETLRDGSKDVRKILLISIVAITIVSVMAIILLAYISTRKISKLSDQIKIAKYDAELKFNGTGLREIDNLIAEVEKLNRSIISNSKITGKIMELTHVPMGCYEVSSDKPDVSVTDHICDLLGIHRGSYISKDEWMRYFKIITADQSEENNSVFSYVHPVTKKHCWLRVNESDTDTGNVGTIMDVSEEIETNLRLSRELDCDRLTGLNNRMAFVRKVKLELQNQPDKFGAMIFIDLDNLKYINDTYGHDVGDRYLIHSGELLSRFSRYKGIVCRISGDEFAIYLHGYEDKETVSRIIDKELIDSEDTYIKLPGEKKHLIRFSGGVAWYPEDSANANELIKYADYAMYEAKHRQKGTIGHFCMDSYLKNFYILENSDAINKLIDDEMISFAFQPIIKVSTGEVYGYEALMRPTHVNFTTPMEVLQVATAQFMLNRLERMIIKKIIKDIYDNRDIFGNKKIFINSIPNQHLSDDDFKELEKYSVIFSNLVVEFLERESTSPETVRNKIQIMRDRGMSIAIDDFGAGFSNELQIISMEPDVIKIDSKIIRDVNKDTRRQDFVKNILSFAKNRGIIVVAEGVETTEELLYLKGLGVDLVQGYLFGHPEKDLRELGKLQKFVYFKDF